MIKKGTWQDHQFCLQGIIHWTTKPLTIRWAQKYNHGRIGFWWGFWTVPHLCNMSWACRWCFGLCITIYDPDSSLSIINRFQFLSKHTVLPPFCPLFLQNNLFNIDILTYLDISIRQSWININVYVFVLMQTTSMWGITLWMTSGCWCLPIVPKGPGRVKWRKYRKQRFLRMTSAIHCVLEQQGRMERYKRIGTNLYFIKPNFCCIKCFELFGKVLCFKKWGLKESRYSLI